MKVWVVEMREYEYDSCLDDVISAIRIGLFSTEEKANEFKREQEEAYQNEGRKEHDYGVECTYPTYGIMVYPKEVY